ncbi:MAG: CAP domain-containing protein [Patescibacteria group bacterium]
MQSLSRWLKKYFIPHEKNEFQPHFLRHKSMSLFLLFIIVIELGFLIEVFIVFDKTNFLASVLPGVLTNITNEKRAENNAPPLAQNELLAKAAELKAQDMATYGYFAHTSPEGKTPWYWFDQVGYHYIRAGENLAINFFESEAVAEAWMNSPTHRANIIKADYTEIGIGVVNGKYQGKNTVFVAQLFGTPIKTISPEILTPKLTAPPVKPKTSPVKPLIPKPTPPPTTAGAPTVIPVVAPITTQILGEEVNSTPIIKNVSVLSNLKSFIQKIATSPRQYSTFVYGAIFLLLILALLLAIFIKHEIQHPKIIGRGLTLVAVIIFLLFLNIKVLEFDTRVPTDDLTANAISSVAN